MVRINDRYTITKEPISLTIGIIGIVLGFFYLITRVNIINSSFYITDSMFAYFFAAYTLISGVILTFKAMKKHH
jgi:hypothetical protein